jgi:hypothetical protein
MRKIALSLALAATTLVTVGWRLHRFLGAGFGYRSIAVLGNDFDSPSQAASRIDQQRDLEVGFFYGHALKGISARIPDGRLAGAR